jgi:hypothetical protein
LSAIFHGFFTLPALSSMKTAGGQLKDKVRKQMEQAHLVDDLDQAIAEELKLSFQKLRRAASFDKELKKTIEATFQNYQKAMPKS